MKFRRVLSALLSISIMCSYTVVSANESISESNEATVNIDEEKYYKRFITKHEDGTIELIELHEEVDAEEYISQTLRENSNIKSIQPDYVLTLNGVSNQWGMDNSEEMDAAYINNSREIYADETEWFDYNFDAGVSEARPYSDGSGVRVAIIDGAADTSVFGENLCEYVQDNIDGEVYERWHATAIGSIIKEIAPDAELLPMNVFLEGQAYTYDILQAIKYCEQYDVDVVNCSFSGEDENIMLKEAIENSQMLFVCSVGNSAQDLSEKPVFPAAYELENVISVGAVNKYGNKSAFSSYSDTRVDIAAPGENIESYIGAGKTDVINGTSMSAAFVTGAAALYYAEHQNELAACVKQAVIDAGVSLYNLESCVKDGKALNIANLFTGNEKTEQIYLKRKTEAGIQLMAETELLSPAEPQGWQSYGSMTSARDSMASATDGECIYVFGGKEGTSISAKAEKYNPAQQQWTTLTTMPTERYKHNAVYYDGKIYIGAGYSSNGAVSSISVYDVASDVWEDDISVPNNKTNYSMVVYNDELYVIGGKINATNSLTVHKYNFNASTWTQCASTIKASVDEPAIVTRDGIRVFSNWDVIEYKGNTWSAFDHIARELEGYAVISRDLLLYGEGSYDYYNDSVYVAGGKDLVDGNPRGITRALYGLAFGMNDCETDWLQDQSLIRGLYNHNMIEVNGYVYVFGGQGYYGVQQDGIYRRNSMELIDDYTGVIQVEESALINGSINDLADVDYFEFTPSATGRYIIKQSRPLHTKYYNGPYLFDIYEFGENFLSRYYEEYYYDELELLAGQKYKFSIACSGDVHTGNYSFRVVRNIGDVSGDFDEAQRITIGTESGNDFYWYQDTDTYKFEVTSSGVYNVEIKGDAKNSKITGDIYDSEQNLVGSINGSGVIDLDTGLYYISIKQGAYNEYEKYTFVINQTAAYNGLQYKRMKAEVVKANNTMYAFGGINEQGNYVKYIEEYDAETNKWTPVGEMQKELRGFTVVGVGNAIYLVGGYVNNKYSNIVYKYTISTKQWSQFCTLNAARERARVVVDNNKIYVVGGSNLNGVLDSVEVIDLTTRKVNEYTNLPKVIMDAQVFFYNSQMYVLGGIDKEGYSTSVFCYDGEGWTEKNKAPYVEKYNGYLRGEFYNNEFIGVVNNGSEMKCVKYSPKNDKWMCFEWRAGENAGYYDICVFNDTIYSIGGWNGQTCEAEIYSQNISDLIESEGPSVDINTELYLYGEGEKKVVISAENMSDIQNYIFTVEYSEQDLQLLDACVMTFEKEMLEGVVSGTNIEIINMNEGILQFKVNEAAPANLNVFSGAVNIVEFMKRNAEMTVISCKAMKVQ